MDLEEGRGAASYSEYINKWVRGSKKVQEGLQVSKNDEKAHIQTELCGFRGTSHILTSWPHRQLQHSLMLHVNIIWKDAYTFCWKMLYGGCHYYLLGLKRKCSLSVNWQVFIFPLFNSLFGL